MGKQRKKVTPPRVSVNAIDWEERARELVEAGLCSPQILNRGRREGGANFAHPPLLNRGRRGEERK